MSSKWDLSLSHSAGGEILTKISQASNWQTDKSNHQSWWALKDTNGKQLRFKRSQFKRSMSLRKTMLTCAASEFTIVTEKLLSSIPKPVSIKVLLSSKRLMSSSAWHAFAQHPMNWNLEDSDLPLCANKAVATLSTRLRLLAIQLAHIQKPGLKSPLSRTVKT